ncbi:MAG: dynamin family protein [Candidatus Polarisedimenticolaceae bacterium]|nr:dynamin family protein [Candidatus Polarisedimenticolaceae bacterium]
METTRLKQQLHAYEQWKVKLIQTIQEYQPWLEEHGMATPETRRRIASCLNTLKEDRLTIAFAAEFSRGKTELINAIFFADYGHRLLPSTPGRTTMCPTELFYDSAVDAAYIRLLPIETRLQDISLAELKEDAAEWVHYPLNLESSKQIEEALSQVGEIKRVTVAEAGQLGLYDDEMEIDQSTPTTHVEIPRWRHALISFPHPLLKQGLCILDTPGLNALGHEPELTLNILPEAQAVLFVLAADTGVTRSDLQMWQHHIKRFQGNRQHGLIVVMNKVDMLWDELRDKTDIQNSIRKQQSLTATILGVDEGSIFPVSAQKGLVAKVKQDDALLNRSGLPELETYLSDNILQEKQRILQDNTATDIGELLEDSSAIISSNLKQIKKEYLELKSLSNESTEIIIQLLRKLQSEKAKYLDDVAQFQVNRHKLKTQAILLRNALDLDELDRIITESHANMLENWTTHGLKNEMQSLFEKLRSRMQQVTLHSEALRKLVRMAYHRFQCDHGFAAIQPKMFSVMKYRLELQTLFKEAEAFRNSTITMMSIKHFVVKRFFNTIIDSARTIFVRANKEADNWLDTALQPLVYQIRDHRDMLERRLKNLREISNSRDTLQLRINELEKEYKVQMRQLTALRNMQNRLIQSHPATDEERPRPRLVSNRSAT